MALNNCPPARDHTNIRIRPLPPSAVSPSQVGGVPQAFIDQATTPYSMESVMRLAVPEEHAPPAGAAAPGADVPREVKAPEITKDYSGPLEVVEGEPGPDDDRQPSAKGETTGAAKRSGPREVLPSIIVDLPTRPILDSDRLPPGVAAPNDPTRMATGEPQRADAPAESRGGEEEFGKVVIARRIQTHKAHGAVGCSSFQIQLGHFLV